MATVAPSDRLTADERHERGRSARSECPRSAQAEWSPPRGRPDPVALLEEQGTSRVAELVPIRHGRMSVSPFTFYRGAAYVMASDLASTPRTGFETQLCGDAHLSNFGGFGAPDRRMVLDCNDFDETLAGPWEWDVKRLAASLVVAGRDSGFDEEARRGIVTASAARYRQAMRGFAAMRNLDVWYARLDAQAVFEGLRDEASKAERKRAERNVAKARAKDSMRAFNKLTEIVDGEPRLVSDPPLIVPARELLAEVDPELMRSRLGEILTSYAETLPDEVRQLVEQYRLVDVARKVVGVGSVGTRAFIALLLGRDDQDPLFLQIKEAQPSVLEPFLASSEYENSGRRVVEGQRLMQSASDIMLGWVRATGVDGVDRDFYVRQLWDQKLSALVEAMSPHFMGRYAELCAWTLARAHARSGDAIAIGAYLGKSGGFDRAIADFAESYADQNERDYRAFMDAIETGRLKAETGL